MFKLISGLSSLDLRFTMLDLIKGPGVEPLSYEDRLNAAKQLAWFYASDNKAPIVLKSFVSSWDDLPVLLNTRQITSIFDKGLSFFSRMERGARDGGGVIYGARYSYIRDLKAKVLQAVDDPDKRTRFIVVLLKYFHKGTVIPESFWVDLASAVKGYDRQCGMQSERQEEQTVFMAMLGVYDVEEPTVASFMKGVLVTAVYRQAYISGQGGGESARRKVYDAMQGMLRGEKPLDPTVLDEAFYEDLNVLDPNSPLYEEIMALTRPVDMYPFPCNSELSAVFMGEGYLTISGKVFPPDFVLKCVEKSGFLSPSVPVRDSPDIRLVHLTPAFAKLFNQRLQDSYTEDPQIQYFLPQLLLSTLSPGSVRALFMDGVSVEESGWGCLKESLPFFVAAAFDLDSQFSFVMDMVTFEYSYANQKAFVDKLFQEGIVSLGWLMRLADRVDFNSADFQLITFVVLCLGRLCPDSFESPLANRIAAEVSFVDKFNWLSTLMSRAYNPELIRTVTRLGIVDVGDYRELAKNGTCASDCPEFFSQAPILNASSYSDISREKNTEFSYRWPLLSGFAPPAIVRTSPADSASFRERFESLMAGEIYAANAEEFTVNMMAAEDVDWNYIRERLDTFYKESFPSVTYLYQQLFSVVNRILLKSELISYYQHLDSLGDKEGFLLEGDLSAELLDTLITTGFFKLDDLRCFKDANKAHLMVLLKLVARRPQEASLREVFLDVYPDEAELRGYASQLPSIDEIKYALRILLEQSFISLPDVLALLPGSGACVCAVVDVIRGLLHQDSSSAESFSSSIKSFGVLNFIEAVGAYASDAHWLGYRWPEFLSMLRLLRDSGLLSFKDTVSGRLESDSALDPELASVWIELFSSEFSSDNLRDIIINFRFGELSALSRDVLTRLYTSLPDLNEEDKFEFVRELFRKNPTLTLNDDLVTTIYRAYMSGIPLQESLAIGASMTEGEVNSILVLQIANRETALGRVFELLRPHWRVSDEMLDTENRALLTLGVFIGQHLTLIPAAPTNLGLYVVITLAITFRIHQAGQFMSGELNFESRKSVLNDCVEALFVSGGVGFLYGLSESDSIESKWLHFPPGIAFSYALTTSLLLFFIAAAARFQRDAVLEKIASGFLYFQLMVVLCLSSRERIGVGEYEALDSVLVAEDDV